ncbi:hypothetical protein [Armatimonas sp.]|uniref:hypothetical protein n=1 Tax=Armatimonas sp. TaxID=1872638 RepID=UPI00374D2DFB
MLYSSLKQCVQQVATGTPIQRAKAEETLRQWGSAAVPDLIDALEEELKKFITMTAQPMLRLADLLSEFGDPRSLPLLARIMNMVGGTRYNRPFLNCAHLLKARAEPEDVVALIEAVIFLRAQPLLIGHVIPLVTNLVELAERRPSTEYYALLAIVKQSHYAPFKYPQLYKRLKAALANEALPIPATAAQTTEDLPIPSGKSEKPSAE